MLMMRAGIALVWMILLQVQSVANCLEREICKNLAAMVSQCVALTLIHLLSATVNNGELRHVPQAAYQNLRHQHQC
jgi:ABC-type lipoprotein release transport system permease subunit